MSNGFGGYRKRSSNNKNNKYAKMELGKKVATETKSNIKQYKKSQKKEIDEIMKGL